MLNFQNNLIYVLFSAIFLSLILFTSLNFNLINLSFDSIVFTNISNFYIDQSISYKQILINKNFHVFILFLLEKYDLSFNYYYVFNVFFLCASLLLLFKIIDLVFDKNKINQIFIAKTFIIIISLFFPSMYFSYTQFGKELIVIFSIIYLIFFFFFRSNKKKHYLKYNLLFYFIFNNFHPSNI